MNKINQKIGLGSLSLLLCMIGLLFSLSFGDKGSYGDIVLKQIGLNAWSNGNSGIHYTIFYSSIFFIISIIFGYKFKGNLGANIGKKISLVVLVFLLIMFSLFGLQAR